MSETRCARATAALKQTTRRGARPVDDVRYRIDVNTLHRDPTADELGLNDIGRVRLRTREPLAVDVYRRNRTTGSFILIDEATNDTVGAGHDPRGPYRRAAGSATRRRRPLPERDLGRRRADPRRALASGRPARRRGLADRPAGVRQVDGRAALEQCAGRAGQPAYLLDGDNLRHGLNGDLGFVAGGPRRERPPHRPRRAAARRRRRRRDRVAGLPVRGRPRRRARADVEAELPFVEVWVSTPLEECERRDPKGLYARARAGEITGFTGVDEPYEAPASPDVELGAGAVDDAVAAIVAELERLGVILVAAILELDHVQLACPPGAEDEARAFYGGLLGLAEIEKPKPLRERGGVWFQCGPHQLHLGVEANFRPARKAHPALRVSGEEELEALAERLGEVRWDNVLPGFRRFYVDDPFGNRIELLAALEARCSLRIR